MSIRELVETNKPLAIIVVVVLLSVVGFNLINRKGPGSGSAQRWYYDLEAGQVLPHATNQVSPVALDNGHQGVLAHVYSCGNCDGETFVAYLERSSEKNHEVATKTAPSAAPPNLAMGMEVSLDPKVTNGKPAWVSKESQEGSQILNQIVSKCDMDQRARECLPKR